MTRITRGISPAALIISVLSLLVAMTATSYAIVVGTNQIKDGAVATPKIADNAVKGGKVKDGSLSAADLSKAGKNALRVRAYTLVNVTDSADPFLAPGRTRGFTAVERTGTGQYCLTVAPSTGINTSKVSAIVSPEWGKSAGDHLQAYWDQGLCESGEIGVLTDQDDTDSNDVAFSVLVP
jgi:hypothetical protein